MLKCDIIDPGCDREEVRRTIIELFGADGEEEEAEIGEEKED